LHEEGDAEEVPEKEISELRSVEKGPFEKSQPVHEEVERIAQRKREGVVIPQRYRAAEKHDREEQKQAVERLIEVESELKRVKVENVILKRSLDEAAKYSKTQKLRIAELESRVAPLKLLSLANAAVQERSEYYTNPVSKILWEPLHDEDRKLLNETTEELSGTRQRLSKVQERLTVAEQVTAATQQRELQKSGNSDELQLELTPQHQSRTHTGDVVIS